MEIEECKGYISRKEYMKKYKDNLVYYAVYVQSNIKKDDYVRLITGEIVKVIGIKEGKIYYGKVYNSNNWFDSAAVVNFSKDIIDLIQVGDLVGTEDKFGIMTIYYIDDNEMIQAIKEDLVLNNFKLKSILTYEQYVNDCYRLED